MVKLIQILATGYFFAVFIVLLLREGVLVDILKGPQQPCNNREQLDSRHIQDKLFLGPLGGLVSLGPRYIHGLLFVLVNLLFLELQVLRRAPFVPLVLGNLAHQLFLVHPESKTNHSVNVNLFQSNGISHYYKLDQSISILMVVEWYFSFFCSNFNRRSR